MPPRAPPAAVAASRSIRNSFDCSPRASRSSHSQVPYPEGEMTWNDRTAGPPPTAGAEDFTGDIYAIRTVDDHAALDSTDNPVHLPGTITVTTP